MVPPFSKAADNSSHVETVASSPTANAAVGMSVKTITAVNRIVNHFFFFN
jgi:hypothetical protein